MVWVTRTARGGEVVLSQCLQGKLSEEQLRKDRSRQLEKGEPACNVMRDVLFGPKNQSRVDGMLRFPHTGSMDSSYTVSLAYTPKRVFFEPPMSFVRKAMSVINYDEHMDRSQATDQHG